MNLSKPTLKKMFPHARQEWLDAFVALGPKLCARYQITTPRRWCHFVAQLDAESAGLTLFVENLHYNPIGLLKTFGKKVAGREHELCAAGPAAIAECVYGMRKDLGNTEPGDGARYPGEGPIQVTGKANRIALGMIMGADLLATGSLLVPETGIESAFAFWQMRGVNAIADTGNVRAVTKRVNGGTNGLDRRTTALAHAISIWGSGMVPVDIHPETAPHVDAMPSPKPTPKDLRQAGSRPAWAMSIVKWFGVMTGLTGFGTAPVTQFLESPSISSAKDAGHALAELIRDHDALLGLAVGSGGLAVAAVAAIGLYHVCGAAHVGRYTPLGWIVGIGSGRIDLVQSILDSQTVGDSGDSPASHVVGIPGGSVGP